MSGPIAWLRASGAQADVLEGVGRHARDWETLYRECPRGDWLLGIVTRLGVSHVSLVRAAVACARVAEDLASPDPQIARPFARVLDCADRWTRGEDAAEDVARATRELEDATRAAAGPSSEAAARSALAVGMGVADREVLASAPAAAAEAHMIASIDCGLELAMRWAHDKCAEAVRAAIPWSDVEPCLPRGA